MLLFQVAISSLYCQDCFYYGSNHAMIPFQCDSTVRYVKFTGEGEIAQYFIKSFENGLQNEKLFDDTYRFDLEANAVSVFDSICTLFSKNIAYQSAQMMFMRDSSIGWATDYVLIGLKEGRMIDEVLNGREILCYHTEGDF